MKASITVHATHLGGPSEVIVEAELEPTKTAFNDNIYDAMTEAVNRLLASMLSKRDDLKFEKDVDQLRMDAILAADPDAQVGE